MRDILTVGLLGIGVVFSLIAAAGVLRFPDLYTRMHAAAKVGTLGISSMVLAAAIHFPDPGAKLQAFLVALFLFLTAPVAAHVMSRVGYAVGVRMCRDSVRDEMPRPPERQINPGASGT